MLKKLLEIIKKELQSLKPGRRFQKQAFASLLMMTIGTNALASSWSYAYEVEGEDFDTYLATPHQNENRVDFEDAKFCPGIPGRSVCMSEKEFRYKKSLELELKKLKSLETSVKSNSTLEIVGYSVVTASVVYALCATLHCRW